MAPTTIASIALVLFALLILSLTAYGYWLLLFDGASLRPVEDSAPLDIELAVDDLRRQIEEYERSQRS